jgi:hypothetical protein
MMRAFWPGGVRGKLALFELPTSTNKRSSRCEAPDGSKAVLHLVHPGGSDCSIVREQVLHSLERVPQCPGQQSHRMSIHCISAQLRPGERRWKS